MMMMITMMTMIMMVVVVVVICIRVRALTVPMHLGLIKGALYAPQSDISSGEPCSFAEVPDGPQT
jgi:hypothetical protein